MSLYLVGCERHDICNASSARKSILRPEAACPPSNYLAKKKEAEVKTYVIDPGLVRVPSSNHSSRPFLARGRAVTEPCGIFARSASFTVYAIYDHRHLAIAIASRRIASHRQLRVPSFTVRRVLREKYLFMQ